MRISSISGFTFLLRIVILIKGCIMNFGNYILLYSDDF